MIYSNVEDAWFHFHSLSVKNFKYDFNSQHTQTEIIFGKESFSKMCVLV